ncbi:MAG: M28 family peptidase [Xanthomonadaceae bacterium]|nr:M28 family peptidase [Xanthomonadaceae bacterium]
MPFPVSVRHVRAPLAFAALLLAGVALAQDASHPTSPATPATAWHADVSGMANATDNAGRRAHLRERLDAAGMPAQSQSFKHGERVGENLIANVSGDAAQPLLLIGAHSDRVSEGRGATDNASGSAVALALAERFREKPLQHHRVQVAFWDLEEEGLRGAAAYIADKREKPALYVNFDVFGWGDSLWMMTPDDSHPLVASSRDAAQAHGLQITAGKQYPPTDHLAFLKAEWPAVSYSLVGADEIPSILAVFEGRKPDSMPKVMRVIHSPEDTADHVDADAAAKGIDAVEAAIRAWDARG